MINFAKVLAGASGHKYAKALRCYYDILAKYHSDKILKIIKI